MESSDASYLEAPSAGHQGDLSPSSRSILNTTVIEVRILPVPVRESTHGTRKCDAFSRPVFALAFLDFIKASQPSNKQIP